MKLKPKKCLFGEKRFSMDRGSRDQAFIELKKCLCSLPKLVAPKPEEIFFLYLVVSNAAIRYVLMVDHSGAQIPIYYVSRIIKD